MVLFKTSRPSSHISQRSQHMLIKHTHTRVRHSWAARSNQSCWCLTQWVQYAWAEGYSIYVYPETAERIRHMPLKRRNELYVRKQRCTIWRMSLAFLNFCQDFNESFHSSILKIPFFDLFFILFFHPHSPKSLIGFFVKEKKVTYKHAAQTFNSWIVELYLLILLYWCLMRNPTT